MKTRQIFPNTYFEYTHTYTHTIEILIHTRTRFIHLSCFEKIFALELHRNQGRTEKALKGGRGETEGGR